MTSGAQCNTLFSRRVEFFVDLLWIQVFPCVRLQYRLHSVGEYSLSFRPCTFENCRSLKAGHRTVGERSCLFAVMADCGLCFWSWRSRVERTTALCGGDGEVRTLEFHVRTFVTTVVPCQQWGYRKCAFWQEKGVCTGGTGRWMWGAPPVPGST